MGSFLSEELVVTGIEGLLKTGKERGKAIYCSVENVITGHTLYQRLSSQVTLCTRDCCLSLAHMITKHSLSELSLLL